MKWLRRWMAHDRPETVVAEGGEIQGDIMGAGPLHIDGRLEGDARSDDHLVIGPHGVVRGNLQGPTVSIGGRVHGRVEATERIVLLAGCHVTGDLHAPAVVMEEGAVFEGQSHMPAPGARPAGPAPMSPPPPAATARPGPSARRGGSSQASSA